ncbi:tRNA pseudouridine(38-40) synthase TruA [Chlamydia sp. 17-3921]|uniref:tRNA pseudouridine(38-40) synthase TruA n=1 Tax=Chlamydia sp. 17-3921 TaxID=2675798 RepID=UPI001917E29A|nr:tRNA pseudouridine(38-40) synthase TruA [Chlamydia sp. 17-3921]
MTKAALLLAYQGTAYAGWQRQSQHTTIQEVLETVFSPILNHRVPMVASGRTDSGVHAYGQVVHFRSPNHPLFSEPQLIKKILNARLPKDLVIRDVNLTNDNFHARYLARAKEYHYTLSLYAKPLPWQRHFSYSPRHQINVDLMRLGAQYLIGTHDFASFANLGREYNTTIRTLYSLDIEENQDSVKIICRGNGFLYKMVRNLVGSLLDISKGKYPPEHLLEMLSKKDRRQGPPSAPPHALTLYHVCYPPPYDFFCSTQCCSKLWKEEKTNNSREANSG